MHDNTIAPLGARAWRRACDELGFMLANRIPRRWLTLFMGWFSRIERPWIARPSLALWRRFSALDLSDARDSHFRSVHHCFTRELKPDARPVDPDPDVLVSPADALIGASGPVREGMALQCKGLAYSLDDLLGDRELAAVYAAGHYVTLRLTPTMYHRFHAPDDCRVEHVTYFSGDTWNVNPVALRKVHQLFCRNERAVIRCRLNHGSSLLTLVPVAAILVASIRLRFLDVRLHLRYRGPNEIPCDAPLTRGAEMGWFEHGSTVIVLAPPGYRLAPGVREGQSIRMGRPLLARAAAYSAGVSATAG